MACRSVSFIMALLLLTTMSMSISMSMACNQQDKAALIAFRNSFPSNTFPDWTDSNDCCFWQYIRCNKQSGRVVRISIKNNKNITGTLPPSIGDLSALQIIYFQDLPNLLGPIPSTFSKLTSLQDLTIYQTGLSGPIPPYLSTFTSLQEINIINNKFVGTIPASLGDLVRLGTIDLSGNQLTGTIPASLFSKLDTSLQADMDLSNNQLTGAIPQSFGSVPFTNINLGTNNLTGDASFLFGAAKPVSQIILANNRLAFDLTSVQYPLNLQYLDISHNQIYGSISTQITQLTNFGYLDVSYNMLCGQIPSGGNFKLFDASFYSNNKCLCGTPLPPCSN